MTDFMGKLAAFLTTSGSGNPNWTGEDVGGTPTNGFSSTLGTAAWSQAAVQSNTDDIQVAFQYDTGGPNYLGCYQYNHASGAGNYDNARSGPWDQNNDSGNGAASTSDATIDNERSVLISNTPIRYWAFCGRSPYVYAHIVVEESTGKYSHFGWGELQKFNDWQGGAYCYGQRHQGTFTNSQAVLTGSTALLDGYAEDGSSPNPTNDMEQFLATINIESLPNQASGGMWAVVGGGGQSDRGQDRQSNDGVGTDTDRELFVGGFRANEVARGWGWSVPNLAAGFVGAYPIACMYYDIDDTPSQIYGPMGVMPDVYGVNIDQFSPGDEITIGSDTFVLFPTREKAQSGTDVSRNQGIMYKKN